MRSRRRSSLALAGAVFVSLAVAGCAPSDEGTQPAPAVTTFEQGDFANVPLPPRAEPVSNRSEEAGVVARSFAVRDTSPEAVLEFYREQLPATNVVEAPHEIGVNSFRGRWLVDGRELTVSATVADTLDAIETFGDDVGVITQLSLSLAPRQDDR